MARKKRYVQSSEMERRYSRESELGNLDQEHDLDSRESVNKVYERARKTYERDARRAARHQQSVNQMKKNIVFHDLLRFMSFVGYVLALILLFSIVWGYYQLL